LAAGKQDHINGKLHKARQLLFSQVALTGVRNKKSTLWAPFDGHGFHKMFCMFTQNASSQIQY